MATTIHTLQDDDRPRMTRTEILGRMRAVPQVSRYELDWIGCVRKMVAEQSMLSLELARLYGVEIPHAHHRS